MLFIPEFTLYISKVSKAGKFYYFFLENWISLFIPAQLSFLLKSAKKILYGHVLELFNLNPKSRFRKISYLYQLFVTFLLLMFQIFIINLLLKVKKFEPSYLCKEINNTSTF